MEEENKIEEVLEEVLEEPTPSSVPELYIGNKLVSEITESEETFSVRFFDETEEVYHKDYKELIVTDKPIGTYELKLRKANIIVKPLLDNLVKYDYPNDDLQHVIKVLTEILQANQDRCYTKLFGRSPNEVSMKDFTRILE